MAGTVERTIALKLIGDVNAIGNDLRPVNRGIDKANKGSGRLIRNLKGVAKGTAMWGKAFAGALVIAGIEKVVDALGNAWRGFRAGQRITAQLALTWRNTGREAARLQPWIDRLTQSTLELGTSDDEAIASFNRLLQTTGNAARAYRRYEIAQDLVANGSAPNLAAAEKMIQQAAKGSARVVDRFGLTSKTAAGRVNQLANKVRGAGKAAVKLDPLRRITNKVDEHLEGIVGAFGSGDIEGGIENIRLAVADLVGEFDLAFPDISKAIEDSGLGGILGGLSAQFGAMMGLISATGGALSNLQTFFQPLIDLGTSLLNLVLWPMTSSFSAMAGIMNTLAALMRGDFSGAVTALQGTLQGVADSVSSAFQRVGSAISGLMRRIIAIWNNLDPTIPAGSFDLYNIDQAVADFLRIPANGKIEWAGHGDMIPDIGRSWDMPSSGRGPSGGGGNRPRSLLGGGGVTAPPEHFSGMGNVPYDGYIASLHKGEAVVTAAENRGGGRGSITIVFNGIVGDPAAVGRMVVRAIQSYEKRGGPNLRRATG
jgi:hypothetical protein